MTPSHPRSPGGTMRTIRTSVAAAIGALLITGLVAVPDAARNQVQRR
ncbi:hypothetical protein CU044_2643 [Streptomyces sp. L-9-10]|nr:hypothetical protein CU044_2643 [Streptomyces sp. L-9-10]